jgi:Outer membrane protein beta-barrel domain
MRKFGLLAALALAAGTAHADTLLGLYAGAGITQGKVENFRGTGLDIDNTNWKIFAGLHPKLFPLGVEVEYLEFGSQTRSFGPGLGAHAEAKSFAGYAVGYLPLPLPLFDVYGKLGLSRWQLNGSVVSPQFFGLSDHGTQFTWGVGGQVHFGNLAGRLEYERFNISGTDGANVYTLGVLFHFL